MDTAYTAHLRVGAHTWDIDSSDPATYGPMAGIKFGWTARQDDGWPTQHDPTLLTFGVVVAAGTDFDDVDQGTWVHYKFTPAGYATPLVEFGGTVRDLTATPDALGMLYTITAIDALQKLKEDYSISAFFPSGESTALLWPRIVQSANLNGSIGITPDMPDPLSGDTKPLNGGGFWGAAFALVGSAWDIFTGIAAGSVLKVGATPLYQRIVLTYRLDASGDLLAAQPFKGTWLTQGNANAPLGLVDGPNGWTIGGGNIDGSLLPTDSALWARQRIEPNVVTDGTFTYVRPHTGPDIVRDVGDNTPDPFLSGYTDPYWIVEGIEPADQWSTDLEVVASVDQASVAGWFTLPTAMRIAVACRDIDSRHTPTGRTVIVGMLAGATLVVDPGGRWRVGFSLRRTIPDPKGVYAGWPTPTGALTYADIDPSITYTDLTTFL